jgi:putative two-component system response regulator
MTDAQVHRYKILVVDDTADNLALMASLLKDRYRVSLANNGENALKFARDEEPPDLILLGIVMPGKSGTEVCRSVIQSRLGRD